MPSKRLVDDLALFGGAPAFDHPLHVGRPNIGDRGRLFERINDILDRHWLTNDGQYVQAFERQLQSITGVQHCIATCNGTLALALTAQALEFSGEVIVPSYTYIATVHVLQWHGIQPVFCDIDPDTHNLDPEKLNSLITAKTSGIIGVHVWGRPCTVEPLREFASQHSLPLVFDAAHAFGCSYKNEKIGNFGNAEVFSFHATKYLNSFEGGAVVTNDGKLARKLRLMRNYGFAGLDEVISLGTNAKMSEVCAAMGLTNLESIEHFIQKNRENYRYYRSALDGIPGLSLITYEEQDEPNYQYIVLEIEATESGIHRDIFVDILHSENILARRYFYPGCHRMEPYRTLYPQAGETLPETEKLVDKVMCLPTGTAIDPDNINAIVDIIRFVVTNAPEISERLRTAR